LQVGVAVVLGPGSKPSVDTQEDVKKFARDHLGISKAPRYWKFLDDPSVLPMTASRKYIRNGLASLLGVEAESFDAQAIAPRGVAHLSSGLSGLRYLLSVGVMFNHIGAVWQGEDERNPLTWGQSFFPGKASTFYFPATVFFVLGGYSLSSALAARKVRGYWGFVTSRFKTLLPLYWLALVLALINLLVVCQPSQYSSNFSWQPNMLTRLLPDGSFAQCQSAPVELPYGWWLFLTLLVYFLGMQAWFFAFILAGWILYYSWFFSVYFFVLFVFKWMHNGMVASRGKGRELLLWGLLYTFGVMLSAFALGAYFFFPPWEETFNVEEAKSLSYNFANVCVTVQPIVDDLENWAQLPWLAPPDSLPPAFPISRQIRPIHGAVPAVLDPRGGQRRRRLLCLRLGPAGPKPLQSHICDRVRSSVHILPRLSADDVHRHRLALSELHRQDVRRVGK
jgi:hypothetical protein